MLENVDCYSFKTWPRGCGDEEGICLLVWNFRIVKFRDFAQLIVDIEDRNICIGI